MTGYSGVQYDNDRQTSAAPTVANSFDAMTDSRSGATALSAAQQSNFWGHETGPVQMRTRAADMFDTMSELLAAEEKLIQEFEAYMHRAMKEFTGAEYTNETDMKKILSDQMNQFLKSPTVGSMTALLARVGIKATGADLVAGWAGPAIASATTAAASATSGAAGAAANVAGAVGQQPTIAPVQNNQPTV
jgi:hypothetical protein